MSTHQVWNSPTSDISLHSKLSGLRVNSKGFLKQRYSAPVSFEAAINVTLCHQAGVVPRQSVMWPCYIGDVAVKAPSQNEPQSLDSFLQMGTMQRSTYATAPNSCRSRPSLQGLACVREIPQKSRFWSATQTARKSNHLPVLVVSRANQPSRHPQDSPTRVDPTDDATSSAGETSIPLSFRHPGFAKGNRPFNSPNFPPFSTRAAKNHRLVPGLSGR
jgi:hypothetical protein